MTASEPTKIAIATAMCGRDDSGRPAN
jgi:hypothetical protein